MAKKKSKYNIDVETIMALRNQGMTYKEIAQQVKCSVATVDGYIKKKEDYEELQCYRELDAAMKIKGKQEFDALLKHLNVRKEDIAKEVQDTFRAKSGERSEKQIRPGVVYGATYNQKDKYLPETNMDTTQDTTSKFSYESNNQEYGTPETVAVVEGKEIKTGAAVLFDRLETLHALPPGGGAPITFPWQNYAGVFRAGNDFYLPADQAIQQSRVNARNMWNNLVIREALQSRLWTASQQEWHIEPFDSTDDRQLHLAKEIQSIIENIPDFLKMRYSLLKSRFFGTYGVQLVYNWDKQHRLKVKKWNELHGDSLVFKMSTDEIGIYVSSFGQKDAKNVTSEAGYIGRAHVYEDGTELKFDPEGRPYYPVGVSERDAIIVMRYDPQATDFLDSRNAGGIVGLGLRSTIYPSWYVMTEVEGNLVDWLERIGTGVVMYKFLRGNESSYNAAVQLAESQSNQSAIMVPVDMETGGKVMEGVEIVQASAIGLDNMMKVIKEIYESRIRKFIVGQDSTSQPVQTGLGSKIASVQEATFFRIISFDCYDLAETLTHQLVRVIQKWSFPDTEHIPCKFVIDYEKPNVQAQLEAAKILHEMGIPLDMDEVRKLTGLSKPKPGADVTEKEEPKPPMMHPGMMNNLNPEGEEEEGEEENPKEDEKIEQNKDK